MHWSSMQKYLANIERIVPEICSRTDRQTDRHTDTLITIPDYRGRSKPNGYRGVARIFGLGGADGTMSGGA